jgi:hypothetical protein
MTIHNANVFYELGIRHALRKKRSVLIRGTPVADDVSFDNLTDRYLAYDLDKPEAALQGLTDTLTATLASENTDSPIFEMLPALREVDPASVQVLPQDLRRWSALRLPKRRDGYDSCRRRSRPAASSGRQCA